MCVNFKIYLTELFQTFTLSEAISNLQYARKNGVVDRPTLHPHQLTGSLFPFQVHHFEDISEEGQAAVGNTPNGLVEYVTKEFPYLLIFVWLGAQLRRLTFAQRGFYTKPR